MPNLKDDIDALSFAAENINSPDFPTFRQAKLTGEVLGLGVNALKELQDANDRIKADPNDAEALDIRNRAFDVIATKRPSEEIDTGKGITKLDRFAIKNVMQKEPTFQAAYLARKGFQTRETPNGIEYKRPGEGRFQPVDPNRLDWQDVTDVTYDVIQGALQGFSTAGKAFTAPTVVAPALIGAVSGGIGGFMELLRQGAQKALGVREGGLDYGGIGKEAAISGVGDAALSTLGKGLKYLGNQAGIAGVRDAALKGNVAEIDAAAKEIGAVATPGRRSASLEVQKAEDALTRVPGFFGLNKAKNTAAKNYAAEDKTAREIAAMVGIVPDTQRVSDFAGGQAAKVKIGAKIKAKVDEASKIFNEIETKLDRKALSVDKTDLEESIRSLSDDYEMDDKTIAWLARTQQKLDNVTTIGGLKKLKTAVASDLAENKQNPNMRRAASVMLSELESAKANSFNTAINRELEKLGWIDGMTPDDLTKKAFKDGADKITYFRGLQKDLGDASKLWREANTELAAVLKRPGEDLKGGANYNLQKLMKGQPEKVLKKVLAEGDSEKIKWLSDNFPDALQAAYGAKVGRIQDELQAKIFDKFGGESVRESQFATRVVNAIAKLSPEDKTLLLGADAKRKFQALQTFMNSKTPLANNSGTAYQLINQSIMSAWKEPVSGLVQMLKQANRLQGASRGSLIRGAGKAIDSPVTRGALGTLLPGSEQGQGNVDLTNYLLIPPMQ